MLGSNLVQDDLVLPILEALLFPAGGGFSILDVDLSLGQPRYGCR
jgi:hypothetical protein